MIAVTLSGFPLSSSLCAAHHHILTCMHGIHLPLIRLPVVCCILCVCVLSFAEPDSVIVHVIRGENSAAMQHESRATTVWVAALNGKSGLIYYSLLIVVIHSLIVAAHIS